MRKFLIFFASAVFSDKQMKLYLSNDAYKKLQHCIRENIKVDRDLADQVASAMKAWALKLGATHYTHWFQPLSGTTAEKHDSFSFLMEQKALKNFLLVH